jgi:putative ATPase
MNDRLFDSGDAPASAVPAADAPLAVRMRPRTLDELVGQEHILGPGSGLRKAIEGGHPHSAILYGPPGAGKTTLARIAAAGADGAFEEESAVNAGKAEIKAVIGRARERRTASGRPTILFLDEIHRFNKAQQDALLPAVEEGLLTLIGATTENPYFEVNSALLSRCQVYELRSLGPEQVQQLLRRALSDPERGIADPPADIAAVEDALQRRAVDYDRSGDRHYDFISAWIKATRGSDVDASLYYLAVMLEGGEDPRFIARRMVILASEDVGNADPQALQVAAAAAYAVEHVGMPEASHTLAQAAIYLSLAPKSNAAYRAIAAARRHVREHGAQAPPDALRSAAYPGAAELGRGAGYDYPHDHPGHVSPLELMPEGLQGTRFYEPGDAEAAMAARLEEIRKARINER